MAALEELCEAVKDLPSAEGKPEAHTELLAHLRERAQLARSWEASAQELLGNGACQPSLEQLEVWHPCFQVMLPGDHDSCLLGRTRAVVSFFFFKPL